MKTYTNTRALSHARVRASSLVGRKKDATILSRMLCRTRREAYTKSPMCSSGDGLIRMNFPRCGGPVTRLRPFICSLSLSVSGLDFPLGPVPEPRSR